MRALGHIADPVERRLGAPIRQLVGASLETLPDEVDLRAHVRRIRDQGAKSKCVGAALACAIEVRASIGGAVLDVSDDAIYAVARELEHPGATSLKDAGSFPSRAIEGLCDWGVCARARWPEDVDPTMPVPLDVLEAGAVARLFPEDVYRIDESGPDRSWRVRQALSQGHPVTFAMLVDKAYEDWTGKSVYTARSGESKGGHYQCIVGYRPDAFLVCGSWGTTFGDRGFVWLGIEYFEGPDISDVQVIVASPTEVR